MFEKPYAKKSYEKTTKKGVNIMWESFLAFYEALTVIISYSWLGILIIVSGFAIYGVVGKRRRLNGIALQKHTYKRLKVDASQNGLTPKQQLAAMVETYYEISLLSSKNETSIIPDTVAQQPRPNAYNTVFSTEQN